MIMVFLPLTHPKWLYLVALVGSYGMLPGLFAPASDSTQWNNLYQT